MSRAKLNCVYLYQDGHAVLVYEKHDHKAKVDYQYVEIIKDTGIDCLFEGRLIFHHLSFDALWDIAKKSKSIQVSNGGSINSKKMNLKVATLVLKQKNGKSLFFQYLPEVLSGGVTHQPNADELVSDYEEEDNKYFWGTYRIAKII